MAPGAPSITFWGRHAARSLLFGAVLALALAELFALHWLQPLELGVLDTLVRRHAATLTADPDIVIVDIDDASLARMEPVAGNWPWPRAVHAELLEGILKQRPSAVVFDLAFSEKDVYRPDSDLAFNEVLARQAAQAGTGMSGLPAFGNALSAQTNGGAQVFFPIVRLDPRGDHAAPLAAQVAPLVGLKRMDGANPQTRIALQPPLVLDPAHWRLGTINFLADSDGVGRRYSLYVDKDGWRLPSLPARVAEGLGAVVPEGADLLLAWRGRRDAFARISYAELYDDLARANPTRPAGELAGKVVLIGTNASTLNDLRPTPIDSQHPGIQVLATAIDNLKNQRWMHTLPVWVSPLLALVLLASLYAAFVRGTGVLQTGAVLLIASGALLLILQVGVARGVRGTGVAAVALAWLYYVAGALQAYLAERATRQRAVQMFSRFVNPHVVQQLVTTGAVRGAGESRDITVLFSDIRGFTTLSEQRTPEDVVALLNRYFTLQVEVIFRHGGSLDKFIGDCIMAFWGAPLDQPDHARRAVAAALEMAEVLRRFKIELGEEDADFDVGIGLHSGPAVVGLIGSDQRREYTAIGDTVNLASRIEGLTRGVARILVSDETRKRCGEDLLFRPHGAFEVKGRVQGVELFEPVPAAATQPVQAIENSAAMAAHIEGVTLA